LEHKYALTQPELFTIKLDNGKTRRGGDQKWYSTDWQRKAGCGPTTAATMLAYLALTRPELRGLYPSGSRDKADFVEFMEKVWGYVTPGRKGLNSVRMFTSGVSSFAEERQCVLHTRELDIPRFRIARPSFSQCAAFLRTGLTADCPVAFLNFSHGEVTHLDSWHWVPIIAMEQRPSGQAICTILSDGREQLIDFRLWYHTSRLGGGLSYIPRESEL
jgi:hypothetical protein